MDCMIALPGSFSIRRRFRLVCGFWRAKEPGHGWRDRRGELLFIDARKLGHMVDRTQKGVFRETSLIAGTYHGGAASRRPELMRMCRACKAAAGDIRTHNHVLTTAAMSGGGS